MITSVTCNGGSCASKNGILTIIGTNFGDYIGSNSVYFGSNVLHSSDPVSCSITTAHTRIECSGMTGVGLNRVIYFRRIDGQIASSTVNFECE